MCNGVRMYGRFQRNSAGLRSNSAIFNRSSSNQPEKSTESKENTGAMFGHRVSPVEKYMLVWTKKYASVKDVPAIVSNDMMQKARNKTRIYINVGMVILTLLACLAMIQLGKRDLKEGMSVQKMNLEWHRKIKEEGEAAAVAENAEKK